MRTRKILAFLVLGIMLFLVSCKGKQVSSDKITVYVSILPQKFFVEKIAKGKVKVEVMVKPGHSPATYEPTPNQMAQLQQAKIYYRIGVPFEKLWIEKIKKSNTNLKIVDTREDIILQDMSANILEVEHKEEHKHEKGHDHDKEEHKHEKGHDHKHDHSGKDPHIWLSPKLVKTQARNIQRALTSLDPENKEFYRKNYYAFIKELDDLHEKLEKQLSKVKTKTIMVFHPAWGYFVKEFGFKQLPIEIQGKSPSPAELTKIITLAKKLKVKVIFVQKQFSTKEAEAVSKEIGAKVIQINPLAENYIENLENIAHIFEKELN